MNVQNMVQNWWKIDFNARNVSITIIHGVKYFWMYDYNTHTHSSEKQGCCNCKPYLRCKFYYKV